MMYHNTMYTPGHISDHNYLVPSSELQIMSTTIHAMAMATFTSDMCIPDQVQSLKAAHAKSKLEAEVRTVMLNR